MPSGSGTCRACFWRSWTQDSRARQGAYADRRPVSETEAGQHAENHGYDYLEALIHPSLPDDPHRVRCRYCGRISAQRLADIGWGCSCQVNPRRDQQTAATGAKKRPLLKDSGRAVLAWWDHDHNDATLWETATVRARREAQWRCPDCGLRFTRRILDMTNSATCPDCEPKRRAARQAEHERLRVTPVADVPELLAAWADEADPRRVTVAGDHQLRRFRCPQGHQPRISPHRYLYSGCPICRGLATRASRREAVADNPSAHRLNPEIASQWHPTKNGKTKLETVSPGSRLTFWWRDPVCGHEWQETPTNREKRQRLRCPECRTILDSLAYHFPELAAEWSPDNPLSAWQVRPNEQTSFLPTWACSADQDHVWKASLSSRTTGSGCPECREHGKSNVELDHHAAAVAVFGRAASGHPVDSGAPGRQARWFVDITVELPTGEKLAIEYDGSYWHADKIDLDTKKSRDLLAAGYLVARLREHPLPPLPVRDDRYTEFTMYATTPDADAVIRRVSEWAMAVRS